MQLVIRLTSKLWTAVAALAATLILVAVPASSSASDSAILRMPGNLHFQMAATNLFSDTADAREDIRQAVLTAASEHKRVLLDFGGNWCGDCQLLNIYFHDPSNAGLLSTNYVLVDVNIGQYDKNLDLVRKYGIPLNKGVPALAVLDGTGHVVYAQRNGEFESMGKLDSTAVTAFLQKWKATPHVAPTRKSRPAGE